MSKSRQNQSQYVGGDSVWWKKDESEAMKEDGRNDENPGNTTNSEEGRWRKWSHRWNSLEKPSAMCLITVTKKSRPEVGMFFLETSHAWRRWNQRPQHRETRSKNDTSANISRGSINWISNTHGRREIIWRTTSFWTWAQHLGKTLASWTIFHWMRQCGACSWTILCGTIEPASSSARTHCSGSSSPGQPVSITFSVCFSFVPSRLCSIVASPSWQVSSFEMTNVILSFMSCSTCPM